MGKLIKFVIFVLIIMVLCLFGEGWYKGAITKQSTLASVFKQLTAGTQNIVDSGIKKIYGKSVE